MESELAAVGEMNKQLSKFLNKIMECLNSPPEKDSTPPSKPDYSRNLYRQYL